MGKGAQHFTPHPELCHAHDLVGLEVHGVGHWTSAVHLPHWCTLPPSTESLQSRGRTTPRLSF
jgi:hypothetical protein